MSLSEALRPLGPWLDVLAALTVAAAIGVVATLASGCRPSPCAPERLAEIEAAYVAEMLASCQGYTRATCPATSRIEAKYAEQRSGWVRCSK